MATSLVATGVQFPDTTIQTTAAISSTPTYRNVTTTNTNITLTNADGGAYLTVLSTAVVNINLPAANGFTGSRTIVISNIGDYGMLVYDNAGNYLFPLNAGQGVMCWASVATTAAGTWSVKELPPDFISPLSANFGTTFSISQNSWQACSPLSSTQMLFVYGAKTNSNEIYGVVITNTSGVLTFGTPQLLSSSTPGRFYRCYALSSTLAVMAFQGVSGSQATDVYMVAMTISGTTITPGALTTVETTTGGYDQSLAMTSATSGVIAYIYSGNSEVNAKAFTVSGTTITLGSRTLISGIYSGSFVSIVGLSSTLCLVAYHDAVGQTGMVCRTVSVSGTTLTANAQSTQFTNGNYNGEAYLSTQSATQAVVATVNVTNGFFATRTVNISGTTVSFGTIYTPGSLSPNQWRVCATGTAQGVLITQDTSTGVLSTTGYTISGTNMSFSGQVSLQASNNNTSTDSWGVVSYQSPAVTPATASFAHVFVPTSGAFHQPIGISGSTINGSYSAYAPVPSFSAQNYSGALNATALSSTRAILLAGETYLNGEYYFTAYLCDYSTTTPTFLSKINIASLGGGNTNKYVAITALSATTAIAAYVSGTGSISCNLITMTGNALSIGAATNVSGLTNGGYIGICMLTSTTALIAYQNSSSQYANVLTVSGTSISAGAQATLVGNFQLIALKALSSTSVVFSTGDANNAYMQILTVSGTTVSSTGVLTSVAGRYSQNIAPLSASSFVAVSYSTTTSFVAGIYTVSGGIITNVSFLTYPVIGGAYPNVYLYSATRGIIVGAGWSFYIPFTIQNGNTLILETLVTTLIVGAGAALNSPVVPASTTSQRFAAFGTNIFNGNVNTNQLISLGAAN
jgi:hypothetical protein